MLSGTGLTIRDEKYMKQAFYRNETFLGSLRERIYLGATFLFFLYFSSKTVGTI